MERITVWKEKRTVWKVDKDYPQELCKASNHVKHVARKKQDRKCENRDIHGESNVSKTEKELKI